MPAPRLSLFVGSLVALLLASGLAAAAPRELVIGNEALRAGGQHVPTNMAAFLARIEQVAKLPKGSLKGQAFARPRDALAYIEKNKVGFAILPAHQFVQGRKALKLEVLGRAVGVEGSKLAYWAVTRKNLNIGRLEDTPGLRLAMTETHDPQWLTVLMEQAVDPLKHFKLVEVDSGEAAVSAVLSNKADIAFLYESDFEKVKHRIQNEVDLAWVYTSGGFPPPAFVATKFASAADKKKIGAAMDQICKESGGAACARMAILYVEKGRADTYVHIIDKYDNYRPISAGY